MEKLIFILLLLTGLSAFSQDEIDANLSRYIGASAGASTGFGLSYRYWPGRFGGQIVFTPISDESVIILCLGTTGFLSLYTSKHTRLFTYLAANGVYNTYNNDLGFAIGFGPGVEIFIFENIAFDIMFGYGLSGGNTLFNQGGLGFTVETALHYRF